MARYHVFTGGRSHDRTDGIWGSPLDNPCARGFHKHPIMFGTLFNFDVPHGTLIGYQPLLGKTSNLSCFNWFGGEVPPPEHVVIRDVDAKASSSAKSFKAAAESGQIVLNPRTVTKINADMHPGIWISDPPIQKGITREFAFASWGLTTANVARVPCSFGDAPSPQLVAIDGVPPDFPFRGVPSGTAIYSWDRYDVAELYAPPSDVVANFAGQVESFLAKPWDKNLITQAIAEANSGTLDLLTEIGEAKETIGFVMGLLRQIIDLVVSTKRQVLKAKHQPGKTAAKIADEIASIWMQFRYAVSPIMYTADDILDTVVSDYPPFQSFRSGASDTHEFNDFNGWSATADLETIDRCFVKYQYDITGGLRGLKLNPLSTAWELFPLSFVVDWVLNIGDLLSAIWRPSEVGNTGFQYSRQVRPTTILLRNPLFTGHIELHVGHYAARPFIPEDHIGLTVDLNMSWKRWLDAIALSWGFSKSLLK